MARTFPAALAFVVAFTGSSLPAAAAPGSPASAPLPTAQLTTSSAPAAPKDTGSSWSLPLSGVSRAALSSAPAFTHEHDEGHDDGGLHRDVAGTGAPEG